MNPLVSIIIPHYNNVSLLKDTLKSVFDQDYSNLEVIVVDDHSNLSELDLFWNLQNIWPQIKLFLRPNELPKGANSCRNFGLSLSSGQFINFIDSDDLISKYKISTQIKFLKENSQIDFVVCKTYNFEGLVSNNVGSWQYKDFEKDSDYLYLYLSNNAVWCTNSALFRRYCLNDIKFLIGQLYANEWLLFTRMLLSGFQVVGLNEYFVYRRIHLNSTGRSSVKRKLKFFIEARLFIFDLVLKSKMPNKKDYLSFLLNDLNGFLKSCGKNGLFSLYFKTVFHFSISFFEVIRSFLFYIFFFISKKGDSLRVIK